MKAVFIEKVLNEIQTLIRQQQISIKTCRLHRHAQVKSQIFQNQNRIVLPNLEKQLMVHST